LGRLVERVSGQKLDAYFRAHILEPLAMNDTYFQVPQEKSTRLAKLYQRKEDGSLVEQPMPPVASGAFLSGGGGLFSTAADYIRFTQAIMNGGQLSGKSILKPETAALMQRNQIGALTIHPVRSVIPQLAKDKAVLPGALDKFGFGFALNSHPVENGRAANTMAWAGIFNTFFWIDREKQVCAVLMTQMSPFLDDGAENLLRDVDRAVYSWLR